MKNKYYYRSRIEERKFREIVHCFANDIDASKAALLYFFNRNTFNIKNRIKITGLCIDSYPELGDFDESYFGAKQSTWKKVGVQ